MASGIFVAATALFFTAYIALAEAFGVLGESSQEITAIDAPTAPGRGGFNGFVDGLIETFSYAFDLMGRFFQLLIFELPGQDAASLITVMVFIPLTFVNGFIIFRAIRG